MPFIVTVNELQCSLVSEAGKEAWIAASVCVAEDDLNVI